MRLGAISFNRSTHLPPSAGSGLAKPVMLPLGCAMLAAKPPPNRIGNKRKHNRDSPRLASKGADQRGGNTEDRVGARIDQFFCKRPNSSGITVTPAKFDMEIAAFPSSKLPKRILKRYKPRLCCQIASRRANQSAYQSLLGLLYAHARRPRRG